MKDMLFVIRQNNYFIAGAKHFHTMTEPQKGQHANMFISNFLRGHSQKFFENSYLTAKLFSLQTVSARRKAT